jgi:hypothetical protein
MRSATAAASSGGKPTRVIPVSTLRCTATPTGLRLLASTAACRLASENTVKDTRCAAPCTTSSAGLYPNTSKGASTPAARRAKASSGRATPSQLAPASRAARATGTAPWP